MILFLSAFLLSFLPFPIPQVTQAYNLKNPYTVSDLIRDYINIPGTLNRFDDFQTQDSTTSDIKKLHKAWQSEWDFLIYKPPRIPMIVGEMGTLYQSGDNYNRYQNQLNTSYDLLLKIEDELESAKEMACEICISKQRIELQTCPIECL